MSIHVAIRHTPHYKFDRLVALSPHIVRLRPAPHSRTPILAYTLKITPEKHSSGNTRGWPRCRAKKRNPIIFWSR